MGWKSTKEITRDYAIQLIIARLLSATNEELSDMVVSVGYGDNTDLPLYGYNFTVRDQLYEEDNFN